MPCTSYRRPTLPGPGHAAPVAVGQPLLRRRERRRAPSNRHRSLEQIREGDATHTVIGTLRPTERWRAIEPIAERVSPSSLELYVLPIEGARRRTLASGEYWQPACHGAEGNRTPDLCSAIAALYQLSYSPATMRPGCDKGVASRRTRAGTLSIIGQTDQKVNLDILGAWI